MSAIDPEEARPSQDSLRKRYVVKVACNIIGFLLSFATAGILPRQLGPRAYGDLNYLTTFFAHITSFLDLGTSSCFYTRVARRPDDVGLVRFYLGYVVLTCGVLVAVAALVPLLSLQNLVWPGQQVFFVWLAVGVVAAGSLVAPLTQMCDALGLTVPFELVKLGQQVCAIVSLVILAWLGWLDLTVAFGYRLFLVLILAFPLAKMLWIRSLGPAIRMRLEPDRIRHLFSEFYLFAQPLAVYSFLGMGANILDRWMLQRVGGSIEQGYFGLSSGLANICFLFSSAMTPLITREFSIAHEQRDLAQMARLFRRSVPMLYAIATYFACFLLVQADWVIHLVGGQGYREAILTTQIMMIYPVYQTYGQLSGSLLLATDRTRLYRNVGTVFLLISPILTYVTVHGACGWTIGSPSVGLALKTVLIVVLATNLQLYFNACYLGFALRRYLLHQAACFAVFVALAVVSRVVVDSHVAPLIVRTSIRFLLSGMLYTGMAGIVVWTLPRILGLEREDILVIVRRARQLVGW